MAYLQVPLEWVYSNQITATQFRLICVIKLTSRDYGDGMQSYLGADKLAKAANLGRATVCRELKELEQKGFLKINNRANRSKSNGIALILDNLQVCQNGIEGSQNDTPEVSQNDTPEVSQNDTPVSQNDTPVSQNETPHIDDRFKIINLKFKNNLEVSQNDTPKKLPREKEIAFSGVAENRSTADTGGQAAESSAKKVMADGAAAKAQDLYILQTIKARFTSIFEDLSLSKAGNTYILRKKGKFALIEDVRLSEVAEWLRAAGLCVQTGDYNSRLAGETLIEEAV